VEGRAATGGGVGVGAGFAKGSDPNAVRVFRKSSNCSSSKPAILKSEVTLKKKNSWKGGGQQIKPLLKEKNDFKARS
jgi:hypothetical protein